LFSHLKTRQKLWDIPSQTCIGTFTHHTDKVQALAWNPAETNVLLSAAYDKTVVMFDVRAPESCRSFQLGADPECVAWNPHNPAIFAAATDGGEVRVFDVRGSTDKYVVQRHVVM
jgi:periodic tryptophan protein 1